MKEKNMNQISFVALEFFASISGIIIIFVCLLIKYARDSHKKELFKEQKKVFILRTSGTGKARHFLVPNTIPKTEENGIQLSKNVSIAQDCHESTANVLMIGGAGNGAHQWVKHNLMSGNANYVVVNYGNEYDDAYYSLDEQGYSFHIIRILADRELQIADSVLYDICHREKQCLSIEVVAGGFMSEDLRMFSRAAACIYDILVTLSCSENQPCKHHVQFYIDESITSRLPDMQAILRTARMRNIGLCLIIESIDTLLHSKNENDIKSELISIANSYHAILYLGDTDDKTTDWIRRVFDLKDVQKENESITDLPCSELIGCVNGVTFRDKKIGGDE